MIMISFISFSWNLYWNIYRFFFLFNFILVRIKAMLLCTESSMKEEPTDEQPKRRSGGEEGGGGGGREGERVWRDARRKRGNCTEVACASLLGSHLTLAPPTSRPSGVTTSGAAFVYCPRQLIGRHEAAYLFSRIHSRSAGTNGCSAPLHSPTPSFHFFDFSSIQSIQFSSNFFLFFFLIFFSLFHSKPLYHLSGLVSSIQFLNSRCFFSLANRMLFFFKSINVTKLTNQFSNSFSSIQILGIVDPKSNTIILFYIDWLVVTVYHFDQSYEILLYVNDFILLQSKSNWIISYLELFRYVSLTLEQFNIWQTEFMLRFCMNSVKTQHFVLEMFHWIWALPSTF